MDKKDNIQRVVDKAMDVQLVYYFRVLFMTWG